MKILSASVAVAIFSITALSPVSTTNNSSHLSTASKPVAKEQKIQVAILLDVSNSMDGLIAQAKAQLWNMVTVMGRAKCEAGAPKIEIALYEYGRSSNDVKVGYVKQISAFTTDLNQLSQELFQLTTNGGDEYCGHVIHSSLNELNWDSTSNDYKVIFIAGNEDFLQGDIQYTRSCDEARKKGVIVNTIYCGDRLQGIREHWNLAGECGNGSFTNINQDAKMEDIPTPYDSTLVILNNKLNSTYIGYGTYGVAKISQQGYVDALNSSYSASVNAKRIAVKGNKQLYNNSSWDLVDAWNADSVGFVKKLDTKSLPDSLKNKSRDQLQKIITTKNEERSVIQNQIKNVVSQREKYVAAERIKSPSNTNSPTLETEVEKIIKTQAQRFNMKID